ncbi:MAG: Ig-like domain-containing protein [Oscillospiraceae bacterium]|nr:Ig-like domain-containing protein [Oscillospiraceae bacterium]
MALFKEVKCGRCDRRYSALRSRCPHCGARKNRDGKATTVEGGTRWQVIVGAVVLLAIIAAAVILITTSLKNREPEPGGNTKPSATVAPSGVHVVDGTDPTPTALPGEEPTPTPTAPPTPSPTPEPMVNSITLSRSDFTLSHIGEQYTIQATISPAGTKVNIVWISEDPDVATVDENGTVTAVDHGTTKVSATAGGVIQECIVRVSAYAPSGGNSSSSSSNGTVSLSHYDVTIHSAKSETFKLSVKGAGDNAVISYSSGNSSVASVSSDGTVKAVGNGNTDITVTVTVNGETSELKCKVYVVN